MIKRSSIVFACLMAGILVSCGTSGTKEPPSVEDIKAKPAEQAPAPIQESAITKPGDPVCGMPYDAAYKEWSVYKKDTIHFCSPTCKGVFDKNPEKYAAKLGL